MPEEKLYRYSWRKDGKFIDGSDCVHTAKSRAETLEAELWRHLPTRSYLVIDYGKPSVGEEASGG